MPNSYSRTGLRICFLSILCLAACSQSPVSYIRNTEVEASIDSSAESEYRPFPYVPDDCKKSLFPSTRPLREIEFCRELVIVDPHVIRRLNDHTIKNVMRRMLDTDSAGVDKLMHAWAQTWQDRRGDDFPYREDISECISQAWTNDRIELIAIVNRLDLALNIREIPRGEGRLVYQLRDCPAYSNPISMTLILEFDYSDLPEGETVEDDVKLWAEDWHTLATGPKNSEEFSKTLGAIVSKFAIRENFRRIRTNERVGGNATWAFREYTFCASANEQPPCAPGLNWSRLPHTPLDVYHQTQQRLLQDYLNEPETISTLRMGTHIFPATYDPGHEIQLDWSSETGLSAPAWINRKEDKNEALLLMSFNTCNGCHQDFKDGVQPHIGIQGDEKFPRLSTFLTSDTSMLFPLSGCSGFVPTFGCEGFDGEYFLWNEQMHRVYFMYSQLPAQQSFESLLPPETELQYRYH